MKGIVWKVRNLLEEGIQNRWALADTSACRAEKFPQKPGEVVHCPNPVFPVPGVGWWSVSSVCVAGGGRGAGSMMHPLLRR